MTIHPDLLHNGGVVHHDSTRNGAISRAEAKELLELAHNHPNVDRRILDKEAAHDRRS